MMFTFVPSYFLSQFRQVEFLGKSVLLQYLLLAEISATAVT